MRLTMLGTITESMLGNPSVLVVFAASALLFGLTAFATAVRRGWRRLPAVLAGAGLALALAVTQGRQPFEFGGIDLSPCSPTSSGSSFSETLLNTGMLMPFGLFAAYATGRALGPALCCLAASLLTEAAQATFDTGACVGQDILANTLGGSLAAAAGFALHRFRTRRGSTAGGHDPTATASTDHARQPTP